MSLTVLVDYDSGNLHSAQKAFERMAHETHAGEVIVSARPEDVLRADRVVLPGDGAFPACSTALHKVDGLFEAIHEAVRVNARPFLGICIGMQMLASRGLEGVSEGAFTQGFDWIKGEVSRITPKDPSLKIPHMGWNDLVIERAHPVLEGIQTGDHAYFVHSWQFRTEEAQDRLAWADYAGDVTAIVGTENIVGTQFHPEKSAATGLRLIANFLNWRP